MTVHVGLSLMLDDAYRAAVLPLFEQGLVDAIEWSMDQGWGSRALPDWIAPLLDHYAAAGRLWGHGVTFSAGSVAGEPHHTEWLARLADEIAARPLCGLSEHFGFMRAGALDAGAPLPLVAGTGARTVLARNLARLAAIARVPVGVENLALALHADDTWQQGPLLADVLADVDGCVYGEEAPLPPSTPAQPSRNLPPSGRFATYLVLDLHNLWCQIVNFGLDADALLATYPLARVRCMHVAGGSWWPVPGRDGERFLRDTHDHAVPDEVLALLSRALPRCPNTEVVVLERIGDSLVDATAAAELQRDFLAMRQRVHAFGIGVGDG